MARFVLISIAQDRLLYTFSARDAPMPELPEVETMRRGIASLRGWTIEAVQRPPCRLKPIQIAPDWPTFRRRARGARIVEVGRVGKRVVLHMDSDDRIVFEPRMTGLVLLADPPNEEHLRVRFTLNHPKRSKPQQLLYWDRRGLGSVRWLTPEEFQGQLGPNKLGPDALAIDGIALGQRLMQSGRPIKVALLDQRIVAGIGNLYASEILFLCGIHPRRRCDRLRRKDYQALATAIHEVLNEAIRYEGSTLGDGTYRNALNQSGSYQHHHRVYAKTGELCRACGKETIRRMVQAQRATFFCPRCQKPPRTR
jgi:formamidopyrimidine-DNA glycosylase